MRAFLRFVGERAIHQPEGQLKEYVIATEVFQRRSDYDPRIDSVVRVQAGRLRSKLLEYYATEGKDDKVLIDLPKGKYTPVFSLMRNGTNEQVNGSGKSTEAEDAVDAAFQRHVVLPLWHDLLTTTEPMLVVFSTTIFHGTYASMKLFNSLNLIEGQQEIHASSQGFIGQNQNPVIDHYTGIGEVMGVFVLGEFFAKMHHPFRVKRSLLLTWDDVKVDNLVVLGSPAENLFLLDLPQPQDFVFRWVKDEDGHFVNAIVNTNPQPGEQELYRAKHYGNSPSHVSEDYAVVSLLQGLSEKHRIMILAGINTFGTQAAAEYVTQPEYIKDLITHLNLAPAGELPQLPHYFQILLKVKVNGGVPIHISYVTHHVL
ncbi:MAG TPA: hypothetical protein VFZ34_14505 [Blastocatellia bacterium]|nr:hypothetical protein [Blastocatellia bacterium]